MARKLTAVITGASSGIGRATAQLFASKGYQISLNDLNGAALKQTAQQCASKGLSNDSILLTAGDLTEEKVSTSLIDRTVQKFGGIDRLLNVAGILLHGRVEESPLSDYDRMMNLNTRAVVQLTQKAIPHLVKSKGSIVNVSSINGPCPFAGMAFYCMSKSAIDMFTKCLAVELGPMGVRVNSVNPGIIITSLQKTAGMQQKEYEAFLERGAGFAPLKRVGQADEVARAIYFLASEESGFITGDHLRIDGGRGIVHLR